MLIFGQMIAMQECGAARRSLALLLAVMMIAVCKSLPHDHSIVEREAEQVTADAECPGEEVSKKST